MSLTREFRKNPQNGLQTYSKIILPIRDYLETRIADLGLKVDIDELFPLENAWKHICTDTIAMLTRRRTRIKRKEAYDGHLKRPLTAYMLYGNYARAKILEKNPKLSMVDVSKEIGKGWNELSETDKLVFVDQSKKDRVRFETERKVAYEAAKAAGKLYTDSKPVKPLIAVAFYMKDEQVRSTLKPIFEEAKAKDNTTNWLVIMRDAWKKLDEKERAKYQKLADDDRARYNKELEAYNLKFKNFKNETLPDQVSDEDADTDE
jgi:hypothetical protein